MRGVIIKSAFLLFVIIIPLGFFGFGFITFLKQGDLPSDYGAPKNLAVDKQGFIYITRQFYDSTIYKLDPSGSLVDTINLKTNHPEISTRIRALVLNQQGYLVAVLQPYDYEKPLEIVSFNPATKQELFRREYRFFQKDGNSAPDFDYAYISDITIDAQENLYLMIAASKRIEKYNRDGQLIFTYEADANYRFGFGGFTADEQGNLYVSDVNQDAILKLDSTGRLATRWVLTEVTGSEFVLPTYLTTDKQGNLFIADFSHKRVLKLDSTSYFMGQWGRQGEGRGQFGAITSVATDDDGNVYVADDNYPKRIQKFDRNNNVIWETSPATWDKNTAIIGHLTLFTLGWLPWYFGSSLLISYIILVRQLIYQARMAKLNLPKAVWKPQLLPGNYYWHLFFLTLALCGYSGATLLTFASSYYLQSDLSFFTVLSGLLVFTFAAVCLFGWETKQRLTALFRKGIN